MSLKLLIAAAALVAIVFLLIKYHPLVIIFLSKIFLGKYNPRYIKIYKNFTGKSPYGYCIKDDFLNHIAGFYDQSKPTQILESKASIDFASFPFETRFRGLLRKKGRPYCVNLLKTKLFGIKIFGFRDELAGTSIRAYFHFIDKRFFMGEYSLKMPPQEKLEELSTILQKKYLGEQKTNKGKFIIKGSNDVEVLFEHTGFNLSIKYLNRGNNLVNQKLSDFWKTMVFAKPERKNNIEADLMEKL